MFDAVTVKTGPDLDGPADLVVEVVSPESRLQDRGEKRAEYELRGVSPSARSSSAFLR
jgi:Uma2 family endonuclease